MKAEACIVAEIVSIIIWKEDKILNVLCDPNKVILQQSVKDAAQFLLDTFSKMQENNYRHKNLKKELWNIRDQQPSGF